MCSCCRVKACLNNANPLLYSTEPNQCLMRLRIAWFKLIWYYTAEPHFFSVFAQGQQTAFRGQAATVRCYAVFCRACHRCKARP
jgi:hypothetical protein